MENTEENKWCVYVHTNKINGKKYIGQTCQIPEKRWKSGLGYQRNPYFYNAIQKYGWENFEHEILASNLTLDEANNMEEFYINKFDTTNNMNGYNMQSGGQNRTHIDETKEKIRAAHLGKHVSEETKEKLRGKNSGENHPNYGHHRSEETKRKIGEAQMGEKNHMFGTHHNEEWKENVRSKLIGSNSYKAKITIQLSKDLEFIKQWDCIVDAERALGITGIGAVCRGQRKTAGGFKWMFKEDYDKMTEVEYEAVLCE
jgi:group I intron endonuclease